MAASVLGKRSRSATEGAEPTILTRAKRQAQLVQYNDENRNPFIALTTKRRVHRDDVLESGKLASAADAAPKVHRVASVPAKHGVPECRVPLSPTKGNAYSITHTSSATSIDDIKEIQLTTPKTPRHRNLLFKEGLTTPRHRVTVASKAVTPTTRRTPSTPSTIVPTVYNEARQLFARTGSPARLVGRDRERKELEDFLTGCVAPHGSGCIYISGPPGTGKSALVSEVCENYQASESVKVAYINCMGVKNAEEIYRRLLHDFCPESEVLKGEEIDVLKALFQRKASRVSTYLITLDEIDHLLSIDLELIYNLFQWSLGQSSSLILIGIANALDLTDRFLPRLKARRLKPHLLPFLPYTVDEISSVIATRLRSLLPAGGRATEDYIPFLHPAAIQFVSKKVASQTGDIRKAFDICRRALDLIETETREKHIKAATGQQQHSPSRGPLSENINLSSPISPSQTPLKPLRPCLATALTSLTPENAPRVTIAHMARITSSIFNTGTTSRLQTLNLQQKVVLCALLALERKRRNASNDHLFAGLLTPSKRSDADAVTVKALYQAYRGYCQKEDTLHPLTATEFKDVVEGLETLGLLEGRDTTKAGGSSFVVYATPSKRRKMGTGTGGGDERRLGSCVGEKELRDCLRAMGAGGEICLRIMNEDFVSLD